MRLGRRQFLSGALALGATQLAPIPRRAGAQPRFAASPFTLGVASGYPLPSGVVLWTRLAPAPLQPGGGMSPEVVPVEWEVASDERMGQVVQRGTATATPEWAHSVHVEVEGLEPGRWYWYRFRAGGQVSAVGRTRTAPAGNAAVDRLRFAFASCQQYEQGYYGAYHRMAGRRPRPGRLPRRLHLRIVVGPRPRAQARRPRAAHARRLPHPPRALQDRPRSAGGPRRRARGSSRGTTTRSPTTTPTTAREHAHPREWFLLRRAAAYRAYYEHMPLRRQMVPAGPAHAALSPRRVRQRSRSSTCSTIGSTARTSPARGRAAAARPSPTPKPAPSASIRASRMLGEVQERWLETGLDRSARPLERHRAADAHGPARSQAGRRPAVLDRRLGRLPGRAPAPARLPGHAQARQPGRDRRRRAHVLGDRPQARLRRRQVARGGHGDRGHVDHLAEPPQAGGRRRDRWPTTRTCASAIRRVAGTCASR